MRFPHHQSNEVLVHAFIEWLDPNTKILLDLAVGGQSLEKTYAKLFTFLNRISQGNLKWNEGGMDLWYRNCSYARGRFFYRQIGAIQNMISNYSNNLALGQQPA